ncbi:hypothetical protein WJX72_007572 [[Myrmecia] bisecta]|uniref:Uncharacterized protein n=1 Tax=[Myrmecia] bisecta TaxID=41462 RepID=A0AAW1PGN1_9CHLO
MLQNLTALKELLDIFKADRGSGRSILRALCRAKLLNLRVQLALEFEDKFSDSWLNAGGWSFNIYAIEYLTALTEARQASASNPASAAELAGIRGDLVCYIARLAISLKDLRGLDRQGKAWTAQAFSKGNNLLRLVDALCRAEVSSEQTVLSAPDIVTKLLSFASGNCFPYLEQQARQVLQNAQPGGVLMRALRRWWLAAPAAQPFEGLPGELIPNIHDLIARSVLSILHTGCEVAGGDFIDAWAATILDQLESFASIAYLAADSSRGGSVADPLCINILSCVVDTHHLSPALLQQWSPDCARCPRVLAMLQQAVIHVAAWSPSAQSSDSAPSPAGEEQHWLVLFQNAVYSLYSLLESDGLRREPCAMADMVRCAEHLDDMFHTPTLHMLLESDEPTRLLEAMLRTRARWHAEWHTIGAGQETTLKHMVVRLSAGLSAQLGADSDPQAVLSLLATLRKALLICDADSNMTAFGLLPLHCLGSRCPERTAMLQLRAAPVSPHLACSNWQPVRAYCATWLLPAMLSKVHRGASEGWLAPIGQLLALLVGSTAIDDGTMTSICLELTRIAEHRLVQGGKEPQQKNAECLLIMMTGLLRVMCQLANRLLAEQDVCTFIVLLANKVLPKVAAAKLLAPETRPSLVALAKIVDEVIPTM